MSGKTSTTRPAPAVRRPLSRRAVRQAALSYIDEHGLAGLTMRRLASELGVEAASLYKHVASKDDLHVGVAALVWEEIAAAVPPSDDWSAWLRDYAHAIRDIVHRHPGTLALWATQPIAPVPALELWAAQLQHCDASSCTQDDATTAMRAITAYAIGYASTEVSWFVSPASGPPESEAQFITRVARSLPPDAPDQLVDIALAMCTGDTGETFSTGLDLMIAGLVRP